MFTRLVRIAYVRRCLRHRPMSAGPGLWGRKSLDFEDVHESRTVFCPSDTSWGVRGRFRCDPLELYVSQRSADFCASVGLSGTQWRLGRVYLPVYRRRRSCWILIRGIRRARGHRRRGSARAVARPSWWRLCTCANAVAELVEARRCPCLLNPRQRCWGTEQISPRAKGYRTGLKSLHSCWMVVDILHHRRNVGECGG